MPERQNSTVAQTGTHGSSGVNQATVMPSSFTSPTPHLVVGSPHAPDDDFLYFDLLQVLLLLRQSCFV
jgi:protein-disulfide isomerase